MGQVETFTVTRQQAQWIHSSLLRNNGVEWKVLRDLNDPYYNFRHETYQITSFDQAVQWAGVIHLVKEDPERFLHEHGDRRFAVSLFRNERPEWQPEMPTPNQTAEWLQHMQATGPERRETRTAIGQMFHDVAPYDPLTLNNTPLMPMPPGGLIGNPAREVTATEVRLTDAQLARQLQQRADMLRQGMRPITEHPAFGVQMEQRPAVFDRAILDEVNMDGWDRTHVPADPVGNSQSDPRAEERIQRQMRQALARELGV
jgi:hypothetical protein